MKKVILLLLIPLSIMSCKEQSRQVVTKGEKFVAPEYPKLFTYHRDDVDQYASAIVMGSDGHEYFLFDKNGSDEKLEHYWNCKFCKK